MDATKLARRYVVCALDENGVLPSDEKVAKALAAALVFDLEALHIIKVKGETITAEKFALDNIDDPEKIVYDFIRKNGSVTLDDIAKEYAPANPEGYNAIMRALCTQLDTSLAAVKSGAEKDGLVTYVADPGAAQSWIDYMYGALQNEVPDNTNTAKDGGYVMSPYDGALAILLDYAGLITKYLSGDKLAHFEKVLKDEKASDDAQAAALVEMDLKGDLLPEIIALAVQVETEF